jgi:S1-C subfamily serine protease
VRQQESPAEPPETEILRLRGQVGHLREQLREAEETAKELSRRLQVANQGATERQRLYNERTAIRGPWVGVQIVNATNLAVETTERSRPGVLVAGITPNSPASHSLLRVGDLVQRVAGREVIETQQFKQILFDMPINQPLVLDVLRDNDAMRIEVTPTEWP